MTTFRRLHDAGCFVLPNPWDAGTARLFASMGFEALASTSAGLAFTRGVSDTPSSLPLSVVLDSIATLVAATTLPVQADFQDGYAADPEGVKHNVRRCIEVGVAGLSIEDASPTEPLYALNHAVERLDAARQAIAESGEDVVLTGRAESFLVGHPSPLNDVLERLTAYRAVGVDCLYAPGLRTPAQVAAVVAVADGIPVNVLAAAPDWMTVESLSALGVRRVSVGSAFARVGWAAIRDAALAAAGGSFSGLGTAMPFADLDALFTPED